MATRRVSEEGAAHLESEGAPSVASDVKEERLVARRKRVETKLAALRREAAGEQVQENEEVRDPEAERKSRHQVVLSEQRLEKLVSDGTQLVSNVVVAGDSKEVQHRVEEEEALQARYEKLEAEATAGSERFDEIMRKWSGGRGQHVPQAVRGLLQEQEVACRAMLDEKERLISQFQEELKGKDEQYVRHLKRQAEDVDLLLERMEEQGRSLMQTYREELGEIEGAFEAERRGVVDAQQAEWEEASRTRGGREGDNLEERERRIAENEAQLQHLRLRNMEEFNRIKIKLETDVQLLQQQIQQMKATFQLNAEKLEYNFQVLKKRDEENTVTISQQKRRLTRLQDTLNTLRSKLARQEKSQRTELASLMDEFRKNTEQYRELQKKVKHFRLSDTRRFHDIWRMNAERVSGLATEVLSADRIIHQQQLGLPWDQPRLPESPLGRPTGTAAAPPPETSLSQATVYASQVLSEADAECHPGAGEGAEPSACPAPLVKRVLEMLCREGEFLIEGKLLRLLAPLEEEERTLMKLDSMFGAMQLHTEADIHKLVKCFLKEGAGPDGAPHQVSLIHPNEVPQVLKQFVEQRQSAGKSASLLSRSLEPQTSHGSLLDGSFWRETAAVPGESHARVWQALLGGLETYHGTLAARATLIADTEGLQQQNAELRVLLHQYMQARINRELEVPPTLLLPVGGPSP